MSEAQVQEILEFWFGSQSDPAFGSPRKAWFLKRDDFDQAIRDRFLTVHNQAITDQLENWKVASESCLALIIVLDQFSRNLYRGTPKAFSADEKALAAATHAVEQGFDQQLLPVQRWFIYLPFEHSEQWSNQEKSLSLWKTLSTHSDSASAIEYAQRHADVIQKFGRFPHRNLILNRLSTPDEVQFLSQPQSAF